MQIPRRTFLKYSLTSLLFYSTEEVYSSEYYRYKPSKIKIEKRKVYIKNLPEDFDGFTIVQITDMHRSDDVSMSIITKTVNLAKFLNPDCVVITGDSANNLHYLEETFKALDSIQPPYGKYATLGNWECSYNPELSANIIKKSSSKLLLNSTVVIKRGSSKIYISGLMDDNGQGRWLSNTFAETSDDTVKILLSHNPKILDNLHKTDKRIDLILAGHTHGGQIVYPLIGAFGIHKDIGKKYISGFYTKENTTMYISRGIGVSRMPYRINCPPELTLITLRKQ